MSDPTQIPTLEEVYQAKKDMADINTFTTTTALSFTDSSGRERKTIEGVIVEGEAQLDAAVASTGWFAAPGSFEAGGTITHRNQYLQLTTTVGGDNAGGYTWGGPLPKIVPPGSTPATTGGQSPSAWVWRSDTTVRSDLANGTADIGGQTAQSVADLRGDLADVDLLKGSRLVAHKSPAGGASARTVQSKLDDFRSVKDYSTTVTAGLINANIISGETYIPAGQYDITDSIKYRKDTLFRGTGKSFSGTIIKPTGDFPALINDSSVAIDYTKNTFRDFSIDATNILSSYAVVISNAFLTDYDNIWLRNSKNGINITNSDSLNFRSVMIMENSNGDCVTIGNNARAIRFYSCNFEKNPGNTNPGGVARLNGSAGSLSSADFYGCQWERGALLVEKGQARVFGGKSTSSNHVFYPMSRDCYYSATDYDSTSLNDFGMCNKFENVRNQNMDTPLHEYPALVSASGGPLTFGAGGDEYLYVISASQQSNAAATGCTIQIKEGATVLDTSPTFDLWAAGTSVGRSMRPSYTYISCVRNSAAASGPVINGTSFGAIKGGKNLLTNGTFNGGSVTGWTSASVTPSASGDNVLLTPASSNWSFYQNALPVLKYGKRYIAVAKFSGAAIFALGIASNGTAGARPLISFGISDLYGDGDRVAMLSFEFVGQSSLLSLGNIGSNTPVTVKWIALIEC